MKACIVLFLFSSLANVALVAMAQNNTGCRKLCDDKQIYRCETECEADMMQVDSTCPSQNDQLMPILSGATATMVVADATNSTQSTPLSTVPTTAQTVDDTTESAGTNVTSTINTTTGITFVNCKPCPQNCTQCNFNSTTNGASCTKCATGYELQGYSNCIRETTTDIDDSSDKMVPIVVGSVVGGLMFIIVAVAAVAVVCFLKRRKSKKADVSGQCQLRVVSSDQLNDGKPKGLHQSVSVISDSGELDKLPMAPAVPGPVNYDQLGIAEEEQLDYVPFDPHADQQNSKSQSVDPSQENIYANTSAINANSANLQRPQSPGGKSPKPTTKVQDTGRDSPQMDSIYTNYNVETNQPQNGNFPGSELNNSEVPLEMDEIYINENVEEVRRPSASKPKPALRKVEKEEQEPVALVQDDIYCNDPPQDSPSEAEQLYEVPEGAEPSRQSDIYINTDTDAIYQNVN